MGWFNFGHSKSDSSSRGSTPEELQNFYQKFNSLTGGRLNTLSKTTAAPVNYTALTPGDIQKIGGLGATQELGINNYRNRAIGELQADPSLSLFQRQRGTQLVNQDVNNQIGALNKEREAAIQSLAQDENLKKYYAADKNASRELESLMALADIFYGGKSQSSSTKTRSINFGGGS